MWWTLIFMVTSLNGDIIYKKQEIASYPDINKCIQNVGSKELTEADMRGIPANSKIVYSCNKKG